MDFKVPFGRQNETNALVASALADKDQQYFCPLCNETLTLKDGKIKAKHFAHKRGECTYDLIIHALAEQVIIENSNIIVEDSVINYVNPLKEVMINNRRADAVVDSVEYGNLIIEITVTNPLTDQKLKDYDNLNVLEIDLRSLEKNLSIETLTDQVLSNPNNRTFYPKEQFVSKSKPDNIAYALIAGVVAIAMLLIKNILFPSKSKKRY
jgi:hypothetical protein